MKQIPVYSEQKLDPAGGIDAVAGCLRTAEKYPLAFAPWTDFPYRPEVHFSIAHNERSILLQYRVKEARLQAAFGQTNDPVYQDSCVEFFISFDDGASYYNFEFNCIGTVLAGYGRSKTERSWLPAAVLGKITCQSLIQKGGESNVTWELTLALPLEVFAFHSVASLKGKVCRANFYKCGDSLPEPHFLAWTNIESGEPDFHLPQFFGTLRFE